MAKEDQAAKERERKAAEEAARAEARQGQPEDEQGNPGEDQSPAEPVDDGASTSEDEQAEARRAQQQAGLRGAVPATGAEPQQSDPETLEAAQEVANSLTDLSHAELTRLSTAVNAALTQKGSEPATTGPTLEEISGTLPINREAGEAFDVKGVAARFRDVDPEQIAAWAVRQSEGVSGWAGPAYLRVVTLDGQKHTTVLKD